MLFGLVKVPGEVQTLEIDGFMEPKYIAAALSALVGYAAANVAAENAVKALGDRVDPRVVGIATKAALGGVFYLAPRRANPVLRLVGVMASIGAFATALNDVVHLLFGSKVEEFGLPPAQWYVVASVSAKRATASSP